MAGSAPGDRRKRSRNERKQIFKRVAWGNQNDNAKSCPREILLELKILVGGEKDLEAFVCRASEKFSVLEAGPALLMDRADVVPG